MYGVSLGVEELERLRGITTSLASTSCVAPLRIFVLDLTGVQRPDRGRRSEVGDDEETE